MRNIFVGLVAHASPATNGAGSSTARASIEQVDDTHIAFTLRDGLMWTDGFGPVTADDVKFSYRAHCRPEDGIALRGRLGGARPCRGQGRQVRRHRAEGAVRAAVERRPASSAPAGSCRERRSRRPAASSRPSRRRSAAAMSSRNGCPSSAPCWRAIPDWPGDTAGLGRDPRHPDRGREGRRARLRGRRSRLYLGRASAPSRAIGRRRRRTARSW